MANQALSQKKTTGNFLIFIIVDDLLNKVWCVHIMEQYAVIKNVQ